MREHVLTHFEQHFGKTRELLLSREGIDVWAWPDPDDPSSVILATVGMSGRDPHVPADTLRTGPAPRTELMMVALREDARAVAMLLRDVADYPAARRTFVHWWHTLPAGRPLKPGSPLSSLLLTFPEFGGADFATFQADAKRVDVLWAVPISEPERALFAARGVDALEDALEEHAAPVADLMRPSVV